MSLYNFEYQKGAGLSVKINEDDLKELMDDRKEEKRLENLDYQEECRNNRTFEEQEKHDSGTCESDFN